MNPKGNYISLKYTVNTQMHLNEPKTGRVGQAVTPHLKQKEQSPECLVRIRTRVSAPSLSLSEQCKHNKVVTYSDVHDVDGAEDGGRQRLERERGAGAVWERNGGGLDTFWMNSEENTGDMDDICL